MPDDTNARLDAPREDLIRMNSELHSEGDGNTLVGYAAVFGKPTVIDSWEGRFRESIAPGAFKRTLQDRGDRVKVLFNHGMDPSIGDKPLGKPRVMEEDGKGLRVEVPLADTSYNRDIKELLRSGAIDGMSFRMTVVRDKWDKLDSELPERTIQEIKLYEFGPVTFPAYEATTAGVRAHAPKAYEAFRSAKGHDPEVNREPADATPDDEPAEQQPDTTDASLAPEHPLPEDAPLDSEHPSPRSKRLTAEERQQRLVEVRAQTETDIETQVRVARYEYEQHKRTP